jgi:hypothetical protein
VRTELAAATRPTHRALNGRSDRELADALRTLATAASKLDSIQAAASEE